ncbi:unnamed protein product, partial [Laminaria digitata]
FYTQILYLEGQWLCLPSLLSVFEPTRVRSVMPLHVTNIRNEQAYYCCIAQLLAEASRSSSSPAPPLLGPTVSPENADDMVYVCGDSHTLTPSWREVTVDGR